ncbi:thioredoxin domain-containing protein [Abyssalbus ytuae]|uniref:Thioredoxin domain-containing protein n=1 Tax=Abyssalbus ytuae TaxID=2926907 RepID=A0A9E6ZQU7_9FLAO|nr:thioredoxin domain-containing protein [Abyssalbus ytuae]UOB18815.1 thioredoxin domain-containing protein [Abyssalbus ytuae]
MTFSRLLLVLILTLIIYGCKNKATGDYKYTNELIKESSPYLLQHAHNPVNWKPWSKETLVQAKKEDRPIIISVGYSSCHWCHVMAHESFEDEEVAQLMNDNFINIKIDREERPDVDQVYMNAVQLMNNGHGGWPLNVIALPDGRPFYGGTYYTKEQWTETLKKTLHLFKNERERTEEFANRLREGIKQVSLIEPVKNTEAVSDSTLTSMFGNWKKFWDRENGGLIGDQKFMMPGHYEFLLRLGVQNNDKETLEYVKHTLDIIALRGVYDHVGGGFYRYSTDSKWKIPHFEKMLYDNAQLVSMYAKAYSYFGEELYLERIEETLDFIEREMTSPEGLFYTALDADSDGEEGKYYIWTTEELQKILGEDFNLFSGYYSANNNGLWEEGKYVLQQGNLKDDFIQQHSLTPEDFEKKTELWKKVLLEERQKRIKPGLDNKALASWNGLMIKAYVDAYKVSQNESYLKKAERAMSFILDNFIDNEGEIYHSYISGKTSISGFADDYAYIAKACISLYEVTFNTAYLSKAKDLTDKAINLFPDEKTGLFYYSHEENLISGVIKVDDGVIPSPNSVMADNLFKLSHYFDDTSYKERAVKMLLVIRGDMEKYGGSYSNWGQLLLNNLKPFYEIVIVGGGAKEKTLKLYKKYIPNAVFAGSVTDNNMPLLQNRFVEGKTYIYVCRNRVCKLPVTEVEKAVSQLE